MAGSISINYTFAAQSGPIPLAKLDSNYSQLTTAMNSVLTYNNYYVDSGAVNALVVTIASPTTFAYTAGAALSVKIAVTNTGATTINVNGLGTKSITTSNISALPAGALAAGSIAQLVYDGTQFQLIGSSFLSASGSDKQVQFNASGSFSGNSGLTYDYTNNALTIAGATLTGASTPVLNLTQTWNNAGTTFTALKLNVTNTAAGSQSLLADLQVGGNSQFNVSNAGLVTANGAIQSQSYIALWGYGSAIQLVNGCVISWGAALYGTQDLFLSRRGAANFQLGAIDSSSPVAQTLSVQSVVAGTSNTAGQNFNIAGSRGSGSAVGGSVNIQVAPAGTSGSSQNALITAFSVGGNGVTQIADSAGTLFNAGYLGLPLSTNSTGTLVLSDRGKSLQVTTNQTVPNSVFSATDVVVVYNNSGSSITLTAGISTMRLAGTASTGNRTIAQRGWAVIYFVSGTECSVSGPGVT